MMLHNNFQDFVLFLYIHMALADHYLHPSEESVILDKMSRLFPTEADPKKKFDAAVKHYESLSHETAIETIRASFKHFDQVKFAQKYKVYTDMYDVINADGKVEEAEKIALDALKEIINMNAEAKAA
ncbi:MAG: TerB family tellurite resistance protein [Cyclobacteriaceae bacterium]